MASSSKICFGASASAVWDLSFSDSWCALIQPINLQKDKLWIIIIPSLNNNKSTLNLPIFQLYSSRHHYSFPSWFQRLPSLPHPLSRRPPYLLSKPINLHLILLHQLRILDIYSLISFSSVRYCPNCRAYSFLGFRYLV